MIAMRFRSVGWVAGVAVAALACYLVTQRVAAERAALEKVEHRILTARRDVRALETELDTRGRLPQLERWNSEVLALSAPRAGQFLNGEMQLASLNRPAPPPLDPAAAPPPAAAQPAAVRAASFAPAAPSAAPAADRPMLRHATYLKPKDDKVAPAALEADGFAAELDRLAAAEKTKPRAR